MSGVRIIKKPLVQLKQKGFGVLTQINISYSEMGSRRMVIKAQALLESVIWPIKMDCNMLLYGS